MNLPTTLQLIVISALTLSSALGAYTYDYSQAPGDNRRDPVADQRNGRLQLVRRNVRRRGSLISKLAISGANAADYEINTTLAVTPNSGTYILFFRTDSTSDQSGVGTYLSVELASLSDGWGNVSVRESTAGSSSLISATSVRIHNGMTFRATVQGTLLWIYADNIVVATATVPLQSGNAGIGGYGISSGDGFTSVELGPHDAIAPFAVTTTSVASSVFPSQVSLKWQGTLDDVNGIGLYSHQISRNGSPMGTVFVPEFYDNTVSPTTAYTYQIVAVDQHTNASTPTSLSVTTPVSSAVDPRRTGVQINGVIGVQAASRLIPSAGI